MLELISIVVVSELQSYLCILQYLGIRINRAIFFDKNMKYFVLAMLGVCQ